LHIYISAIIHSGVSMQHYDSQMKTYCKNKYTIESMNSNVNRCHFLSTFGIGIAG